jgi:hypothetical protein
MKLTTQYILSLQKQVREEHERKATELETLRKDYADRFLDQHVPNFSRIQSMLLDAVEKNPDANEYKLHILTMGVEESTTFHPSTRDANAYMRLAYHNRFGDWFHRHIPAAYPVLESIVNEKYIEVYLIFSLDQA